MNALLKHHLVVVLGLGLLSSSLPAQDKPEEVPEGVIHGPKAAYSIAPPKGWVMDTKSGAANGLPCVMYPKGAAWDSTEVLIYGKISAPDMEDMKEYIALGIQHMSKKRPGFKHQEISKGKTSEGYEWIITEYAPTEAYPRAERVACVQLPKSVAIIVYSAKDMAVCQKHAAALDEVVKSFMSEPDYIGAGAKKAGKTE